MLNFNPETPLGQLHQDGLCGSPLIAIVVDCMHCGHETTLTPLVHQIVRQTDLRSA